MSTQKNITERKRLLIFLEYRYQLYRFIHALDGSYSRTSCNCGGFKDQRYNRAMAYQRILIGYGRYDAVNCLFDYPISDEAVVSGGIASFHQWFGCLCYRAEFFCYDAGADFAGWR